jgi:hypothetical protein
MRKAVAIIVLLLVFIAVLGGGAYYLVGRAVTNDGRQALDQALGKLPPGWTGHYASLEIEPFQRALVVKGFAVQGPDSVAVSIDEAEIDGADFNVDKEFKAADPATLSPDQALMLATRVAAKGLKVHAQDVDVAMASFEVAQPRLYLWALKRPEVLDFENIEKSAAAAIMATAPPDLAGQAAAIKATMQDPTTLLPVVHLVGAVALGFGFGPFSIDDLSEAITVPVPAQSPPQQTVTTRVKHNGGQGYDRGVVLDSTIDDYEADAAPLFHFTVAHADGYGIDARDALLRMTKADRVDADLLDGVKMKGGELRNLVAGMAKQPSLPLARLSLGDLEFGHGGPVSARFSIEGVKITRALAGLNPQLAEQFDKLHLDAMTIGFGGSYRWNVDARTLAVSGLQLKVDELGQLDIAADLSGIAPDGSAAATGALTHAVVKYKDGSLTDRLLSQFSSDREALRKRLGQQIQAMAGALIDAASVKALVDFLAKPQTLTVELKPPSPLPFATLQALQTIPPAQLARTLGVSVTTAP